MKNYGIKLLVFAMLIFLLLVDPSAAMSYKNKTVQLNTGNKAVTYISFYPSKEIEIKPVIAENLIGKTESLASMATRSQGIAAINGTFFNTYDKNDLQPMGNIMYMGEMLHYRGGPTTLGINGDNAISFFPTSSIKIRGGINNSREWPNNWYAWFVNHIPSSSDEIVIFTPEFRSHDLNIAGFTFIGVDDGIVRFINKDYAAVPSNGFIIAYGPSPQNHTEISKFKVGDSVEYYIDMPLSNGDVKNTISAGPKLITKGEIDINFDRENISDSKLTTNAGNRSFIGTQKDGAVIMGTVSNATIMELAETLKILGLNEAMNLDGGASSGLYFQGRYLTSPGRNLSNSIVVVQKNGISTMRELEEKLERGLSITINGVFLEMPDGEPGAYINSDGRTVIPARFVSEGLGANVSWSPDTSTVTIASDSMEVQLELGKQYATVNGKRVVFDTSAFISQGRTFVPVRFVSEALGANVTWDGDNNTVIIMTD